MFIVEIFVYFPSLTSLEVCEDSSLISAGFGDSKIKIWTLTPNRLRTMKRVDELNLIDKESGATRNFDKASAVVLSLVLRKSVETLTFSVTDDVLERMMDTKAGKESRVLSGHSGPVYSTSFTPDKNLCVSASEDGTGECWIFRVWVQVGEFRLTCGKGIWRRDHLDSFLDN